MSTYIVKGNLCYSENATHMETVENGYIVVENGKSKGIFPTLPSQYEGLELLDFGDRLIVPGMSDLHAHAPQFSFRGLGGDMELLDWLSTYTFPEEAKYADLDYADRAYSQYVAHMKRSATTRAAIFATIHTPATELLMDKMEATGLCTYIGKVNMNRNSPDYLCETSVDKAIEDTERWICHTKDKYQFTKPIITPRFIPSCTDELMRALRGLVEKYKLPVQSHLSENFGEISWVQELCPESRFYGDAYDRFGMFGGDHPCIMAHCVHSGEEEIALLKKNGVFVAHSPESNTNLSSGVAPVNKLLDCGLNVGLATDLAGGSHESMLRAMMHSIQASKLRWRLLDSRIKPLTFDQAFYLATEGGGRFFGKVGNFKEGFEFDAIVLDDSSLDHPQPLGVRDRMERAIYLADERCNYAKFVSGRRIF